MRVIVQLRRLIRVHCFMGVTRGLGGYLFVGAKPAPIRQIRQDEVVLRSARFTVVSLRACHRECGYVVYCAVFLSSVRRVLGREVVLVVDRVDISVINVQNDIGAVLIVTQRVYRSDRRLGVLISARVSLLNV